MREEASSFYGWGRLCWGVRAGLTDSLITSLNTSTLLTTLEIPRTILFRSVLHMGCFTVLPLKAESRSLLGTSQKRFWMMTDCKSSAKRPPSLKGKDEVSINIFFTLCVCIYTCMYMIAHVFVGTCVQRPEVHIRWLCHHAPAYLSWHSLPMTLSYMDVARLAGQ